MKSFEFPRAKILIVKIVKCLIKIHLIKKELIDSHFRFTFN
ncbi:hypothetical protein EU96_1757 [Prochlorococcus marinus str. MIT 9302]|uniref:Uncharacterized protein n=1 Tax=Prochlorococcus marinus str. MIT 9302 TaxID=74545 RepID=A0A0A2A8I9_PROMR|nr:hypothetical protein EU96_1757 [Prochlorococcus marinus str. MIT 9302]